MNKRALIAAGVMALVGAGLIRLYMVRFEQETAGGPPVNVLVAAQDLPIGAPLTREVLAAREIPQAYVERRHVRSTDLADVLGIHVSSRLRAGESVLWSDLATLQGGAGTLSDLVQEGSRAFTLPSRQAPFDGLLRPGDRVDVLFTANEDSAALATRTLLQNLLVLAVGGRTDPHIERSSSYNRGVTVSVTPEQGQVLAQALHRGSLRLVLRNPDDIVQMDDLPETASLGPAKESSAQPKVRRAAAPEPRSIDHVR